MSETCLHCDDLEFECETEELELRVWNLITCAPPRIGNASAMQAAWRKGSTNGAEMETGRGRLYQSMKVHPIVQQVRDAREYGKLGNYEACLQTYHSAKDLVQIEINSCRNVSEMTRWNSLVKEIVVEESSIRRLRSTIEEINRLIRSETPKLPIRESASKPDFAATPRVLVLGSDIARQGRNPKSRMSDPRKDARPPPTPKKPIEVPIKQYLTEIGILIRDPSVEWDAIGGLTEVKRSLRQNLVILPMRPGIATGLLAPWKTVLLYGPPRTGKTSLAKAIATECERTFFLLSPARFASKSQAEFEKLLGTIFAVAEEMAPSLIFLDNLDGMFAVTKTPAEAEATRRMKAILVAKIDAVREAGDVLVFASTSFPWDLDDLLLRPFEKRVYVPLPDRDARRMVLAGSLRNMADASLDVTVWAERLEGYSCGDIGDLCRDAAQIAYDEQTKMFVTDAWMKLSLSDGHVMITQEAFENAFGRAKGRLCVESLTRYDEWGKQKGSS